MSCLIWPNFSLPYLECSLYFISIFSNSWIKAYDDLLDPKKARKKCKGDGNYLHLPIPRNKTQNDWYRNYATKLGQKHIVGIGRYWIEVSDNDEEGVYKGRGLTCKTTVGSPNKATFCSYLKYTQ